MYIYVYMYIYMYMYTALFPQKSLIIRVSFAASRDKAPHGSSSPFLGANDEQATRMDRGLRQKNLTV